MSNSVEFFLSCVPPKTSHHAKRIVRIGKFARLADKPELVKAKATLDELLIPHQIPTPIPGPVRLEIVFHWPFLTSHPKRFRASPQFHTSKPDLSNVLKSLEDRLAALRFIENDAQVATVSMSKYWSDRPGIFVRIASMREIQLLG
jgi:Holliday junction resolvase RusA-like endonuclease